MIVRRYIENKPLTVYPSDLIEIPQFKGRLSVCGNEEWRAFKNLETLTTVSGTRPCRKITFNLFGVSEDGKTKTLLMAKEVLEADQ